MNYPDRLLTLAERQQLALELQRLNSDLLQRPTGTIRELPVELQRQIRDLKILGQITSSGLERISTIIDRLTWLIYYLNDPNFPDSVEPDSQLPLPPPPIATPVLPLPIKKASPSSHPELDFGPFDPRRTQP